MTQRQLSEDERHAIGHAEWAVSHATPNNPDVCFDYELVRTLLGLIKSGRAAVGVVVDGEAVPQEKPR